MDPLLELEIYRALFDSLMQKRLVEIAKDVIKNDFEVNRQNTNAARIRCAYRVKKKLLRTLNIKEL